MTGYESKRAAARDKLDDDDTQVYQDHDDALTIAYQSGFYDGKKAAAQEQKPMHPQLKAMLEEYFDKCFAESSTQRHWVGLTDKDRMQILDATEGDERGFVMKLVEDRLRSKNNAA